MHVRDLMTHTPAVCTTTDHLTRAAQIMWERDCGAVPVIDATGALAGIVTDRDVCMAAYTQGRALHEISVASIMSKHVFTIGPDATAADALDTMNRKSVRRLPVTDAGGRLVGIVSLADFARAAAQVASKKRPADDAVIAALASVSAARPVGQVAPMPAAQAAQLGAKILVPAAGPAAKRSRKK
ncbi:MAG: CBS domain-containing protein [Planctomycetes bacterium]|nr:CBS domain-containing protein [Planctomycetota bacterium]